MDKVLASEASGYSFKIVILSFKTPFCSLVGLGKFSGNNSNLMSYNQEYNEQPIYELDFQYSEDSESDTIILQNLYRSYL